MAKCVSKMCAPIPSEWVSPSEWEVKFDSDDPSLFPGILDDDDDEIGFDNFVPLGDADPEDLVEQIFNSKSLSSSVGSLSSSVGSLLEFLV